MSQSITITAAMRKLLRGLALRCTNCGRGKMFSGLFKMEATCSHCGVRYERADGESIGGMVINLALAEVLSVGGFFLTDALFHPPLAFQLVFWVTFNILFVVLFYRHARGMWVGFADIAGGVYADAESNNESS